MIDLLFDTVTDAAPGTDIDTNVSNVLPGV